MRILNALQRTLMLLLLIPVVAICLDAVLRMLNAQEANAIVSAVRRIANFFILDPFTDVFEDQSPLQDALVALVAYGLVALLIVGVFRGLRAMVAARPASPPPSAKQPAGKPPRDEVAPTRTTDRDQPADETTSETDARS